MNSVPRVMRHAVAYRLDRVHGVSGLQPGDCADRERLALGVKALAVTAVAGR